MNLYVMYEMNKYELPVAVAESLSEMAKITGMSKSGVRFAIREGSPCNKRKWKCIKLEV